MARHLGCLTNEANGLRAVMLSFFSLRLWFFIISIRSFALLILKAKQAYV